MFLVLFGILSPLMACLSLGCHETKTAAYRLITWILNGLMTVTMLGVGGAMLFGRGLQKGCDKHATLLWVTSLILWICLLCACCCCACSMCSRSSSSKDDRGRYSRLNEQS